MQLEQLDRLRVLARRDFDGVAALLEQGDQRPEERHLRRVRDVDPDAHAVTLTARPRIRFAYGHAPAGGVLCGRRAEELLAGGRAPRGHAARGVAAGPFAREAARDSAP